MISSVAIAPCSSRSLQRIWKLLSCFRLLLHATALVVELPKETRIGACCCCRMLLSEMSPCSCVLLFVQAGSDLGGLVSRWIPKKIFLWRRKGGDCWMFMSGRFQDVSPAVVWLEWTSFLVEVLLLQCEHLCYHCTQGDIFLKKKFQRLIH